MTKFNKLTRLSLLWTLTLTSNLSRAVYGKHNPSELKNYAGLQTSTPSTIEMPNNLEELQQLIREANIYKPTPIVALGALHSWSKVFKQDKGTAINLSKMATPPTVDADGVVHASGNMTIGSFHQYLTSQNRAVPYTPQAATATLAGVIATGSHGAHITQGHFYELVTEIKLVDGKGRLIKIDRSGLWLQQTPQTYQLVFKDDKILPTAVKHYGCLGVIYELGIQTVEQFDLKLSQTTVKENEATENDYLVLNNHFLNSRSADVIWFPSEEKMVLRSFTPTTEARIPFSKSDKRRKKMASKNAKNYLWLVSHVPFITPITNLLAANFFSPMVRIERSDTIATYIPNESRKNSKIYELEYGLPFDQLPEVLSILKSNLKNYRNPFPIYLRRCGPVLYVEMLWPKNFPKGESIAKKIEKTFVESFEEQAMPHEGKKFYIASWPRKDPAYTQKFAELRKYLDPNNIFSTKYRENFFNQKDKDSPVCE